MKARLTAVLSLTGVLVAGTAAAVVNTQVLQSSGSSDGDMLVVEAPTESISADTNAVVSPTVPTADTATPSPTQAAYQIGTAGVVVLDTAGDTLTIVSATPTTGWLLIEAEQNDPLNVEVKFQSGSITVEFKANLLFGVVSTSVESEDSNAPTSSEGSATSIDDDDDDDDNSGPGGGGDDHSGPGGGGSDDDDHGSDDD